MSSAQLTDRDWQLRARGVFDRSSMLLASKQLSDCAFAVGTEKIPIEAHKLILGSASPVFHAMFFSDLKETQKPIPVPDVEVKAFEAMLQYIYTDQVTAESMDDALKLWCAAEKYQLPHLACQCVDKLSKGLTPENVYSVLKCANMFSNCGLEEKCINEFGSKATLSSAGFEDLKLDFIRMILNLPSLLGDATELDLFNALERWAKKECDRQGLPHNTQNLRHVSEDAVKKIRFLTMPSDVFSRGPCRSSMLTTEELFAILVNISYKIEENGQIPLPPGFSASRYIRIYPTAATARFVYPTEVDVSGALSCSLPSSGSGAYVPTKVFSLSFSLPVDAVLGYLTFCPMSSNVTISLWRSKSLLAFVKVETNRRETVHGLFPWSAELVLQRGLKYRLEVRGAFYKLKSISESCVPFGIQGHVVFSDYGGNIPIQKLMFYSA